MFGKAVQFRHCPATGERPCTILRLLDWQDTGFGDGIELQLLKNHWRREDAFLGRWREGVAQVRETEIRAALNPLAFRGEQEGASVNLSRFLRARRGLRLLTHIFLLILTADSAVYAAAIRGVVTDTSGAKIRNAKVFLVQNGTVVSTGVSTSDGAFEILTGTQGRFYLVVSAPRFLPTTGDASGFYANRMDNLERNLVLEPAWVRESIVVTATGTPRRRSRKPVRRQACWGQLILICGRTL